MPQIPVDKTYFSFAGGINTEVSPLTFPDGTSLDEQNFEMLVNGTRRRRKGLAKESGHSVADVSVDGTYSSGMACSSYRWTNVAGNPDTVFIVIQVGGALLFATENEDLSPNFHAQSVDLLDFRTVDTNSLVYEEPVAIASGRGYLFVTGRYVEPFYVSYDVDTNTFTATQIEIYIRDFKGVEDGVDIRSFPTTLSDDHKYNLINRGWAAALVTSYFSAQGEYPAKNQIYWKGYRRATTTGYAEIDGIKEFNAAKLDAEAFGDSSAPQGALVLSPFDTGLARIPSATLLAVDSFSTSDLGQYWFTTITTTAAHGLVANDVVTIINNEFKYNTTSGTVATGTLNGTYQIATAPSGTTFTIYFFKPSGYSSWNTQYVTKGQVGKEIVYRTDAYSTDERPTAITFHAGRVFWAGTNHPLLNDTIYFSQIVYNEKQFGRCYQEADPTSEFINALTPADGGTIVVPNMGAVHGMVSMEDALVVFAANGVWAILPASQGGFRADGYNVRKISDVEAIGSQAIRKIDSTITFCSPRGIYVLAPDQNSGQINAASISETVIQSLWNDIPDARKREVQIGFDDSKKRVYYLYGDATVQAPRTYNAALVFDLRIGSFYKLTFPHSDLTTNFKLRGIVATGLGDASDSAKKMKFLGTRDNAGVKLNVYDMDHSNFTDFDGTEQSAYIVTGYDNLGDFARHRQAPVCHVYMARSETGFTQNPDGSLEPVNPGGCYIQARWDFSDASGSGKWSTEQQVYRHSRYYQPTGVNDNFDSGLPVIISRTKLRGRGRCLHLRFRADTGKDCHILGWSLEYKGERKQ